METTGKVNTNEYAGVYAHEAGHLMGLGDHQVDVEVDNPNGPGKVTTSGLRAARPSMSEKNSSHLSMRGRGKEVTGA